MNYHNITKCDILNGDGVRVVLWVSGCSHMCKGCHNAITWDKNGGLPFDAAAQQELFEALDQPDIDGITFSGGDPLFCDNREQIGSLVQQVATKFPQKTIWLYTGFCWEQIKDLWFLKYVDVLVDGPFVLEQKNDNLLWKGSANQRVINVKQSLKTGGIVLHCDNTTQLLQEPNKCTNCC